MPAAAPKPALPAIPAWPRLAASAMLAACADVHAAESVPRAAPVVLPEVTVTATRVERDPMDLPVSIDTVDQRTIREAGPQVNLSESLGRVPGIAVLNRQNHAQDLQVSSRGFGARASFGVRGIRLVADGIPATMPDGQGQAASFNLSSAARIEVMRGPFSSLYGNAAGGVVQVFTADGPPRPTFSGSVTGASYGTTRLGFQYGGQHGPVNAVVDVSRFETDGFRAHSGARRDQSNARVKFDLGTAGVLTLVGNMLDQPGT
ncbi:MAG: TonB-dependent receptor plug domain-containing protein, partial [Burkholderiales bacterium]|nr:TonB-dependent receptor plug domain-containing protein [Burkholderiales bacterium]